MPALIVCLLLLFLAACQAPQAREFTSDWATLDAEARRLMAREGVHGLALAVIDGGRIVHVAAYGYRNAEKQLPLETGTVMYGASLARTACAHMVLQLAEEGRLDLDTSIAGLLPRPLPEYENYADLAGDERWKELTPRILLANTSGLPNFRRNEPDRRLHIHFTPGTRYTYSREGYMLLQFVLQEGLGLNVEKEMQTRIFDRFGMPNTSMLWRDEFASNAADGYARDGAVRPHDPFTVLNMGGSMDTTIDDQARMWAAIVRGDGLSASSRNEMFRAHVPITSRRQFPTLAAGYSPRHDEIDLAAGLGLVTFRDAGGLAWFKGGHNSWHTNLVIGLESGQRCLVLMANDVRAEAIFPEVARMVLGPTDMPWTWEYSWLHNAALLAAR